MPAQPAPDEFPVTEQPVTRIMEDSPHYLTTSELLSVVLYGRPSRDARVIARRLLNRFGWRYILCMAFTPKASVGRFLHEGLNVQDLTLFLQRSS